MTSLTAALSLLTSAPALWAQPGTVTATRASDPGSFSSLPTEQQTRDSVRQPALSYDQLIWVTAGATERVKGRLRSWSETTLEWNGPDGIVRTPIGELQRVEIRDPIADGAWKGALGGFAVGATVGLLAGAGLACERDCGENYSRTRDIASAAIGLGAFSAAGGLLLGTLTDVFVHPRRVVFQNSPRARFAVLPLRRQVVGTALRVSW